MRTSRSASGDGPRYHVAVPDVKETVNDVSITSDVLREIVDAIRPFVQPLEEIDLVHRHSVVEQYGAQGLDLVKNSYSINGRAFEDHDPKVFEDSSLDGWPPLGCDQYTTTFHIRRMFPGARYANTAMYVKVDASTWVGVGTRLR